MEIVKELKTRVLTKAVVYKNADYFESCCKGIAEELGIKVKVFKVGTTNYLFWVETTFKVIITGEETMLDLFEETY